MDGLGKEHDPSTLKSLIMPQSSPTILRSQVAVRTILAVGLLIVSPLAWRVIADRPAAPPMSRPQISLYDRLKSVSVEILVNDHLAGSGWIADGEGHVVTAAHVIAGDDRRLEVLTQEHGRLEAKLVATDIGRDLALLKMPAREGGYAFAPMAAKTPPAMSEVFLMGAPIFRHSVMLDGRVARNGTTYEFLPDQRTYVEAIHVSGFSPRGTSGGAWFDEHGHVIGLQSGMMIDGGSQVGVVFVIPVEPIQFLLNTKADVQTPTLGAAVEELWEQPWDFLKKYPPRTEGLVVRALDPQGALARAGLKDGDVIVTADDKPARLRDDFIRLLRSRRVGDEMKLGVLRGRDGKTDAVVVKVEAMTVKFKGHIE